MTDTFDKLRKDVKLDLSYEIEIGIFENKRKKDKNSIKDGLTNAELLYIHENGGIDNMPPARPILKLTIEDYLNKGYLNEELDYIYNKINTKNWTDVEIELELKKFCKRVAIYCKELVNNRDNRIKPNSKSTIKAKGSDLPLVDTHQMVRAITANLEKIK